LVVIGVAQILSGYITLDPGSQSASKIHENLGLPPGLGFPVVALLMARTLHGARRTLSLGIGALLVLMIVALILLKVLGGIDVSIGVFQRLFIGVTTVWVVVVSLWLRNL
jgi:hypothetical protein